MNNNIVSPKALITAEFTESIKGALDCTKCDIEWPILKGERLLINVELLLPKY